jgi:hypothetical protein
VTGSSIRGESPQGGTSHGRDSGADGRTAEALDAEGGHLRDRLLELMGRSEEEGEEEVEGEDQVEGLALAILRYQARANPVYGTLLRNRGLDPEALDHWTRFPPVPARAFRDASPYIEGGGGTPPEAIFHTSGTTGAPGVHRVRDLSLYHGALLPAARRHLGLREPGAGGESGVAEESGTTRVLALLPAPEARPTSSLAHMAGVLVQRFDDGGGGFLLSADWDLDVAAVSEALARARSDGVPVLLMATAFALVHWLDRSQAEGWAGIRLPPGSRIMETGGYKGRSREVERPVLYDALSRALGVPAERIVNEYGMTEMLSQFYEPVLKEGGPSDPSLRRHLGPRWVRTRVLDPVTLAPVPRGEPGILCHLDLANLYSAALLLTEDLGVAVPGPTQDHAAGFRVLGRGPGATPRGCSLSLEDWMRATR